MANANAAPTPWSSNGAPITTPVAPSAGTIGAPNVASVLASETNSPECLQAPSSIWYSKTRPAPWIPVELSAPGAPISSLSPTNAMAAPNPSALAETGEENLCCSDHPRAPRR